MSLPFIAHFHFSETALVNFLFFFQQHAVNRWLNIPFTRVFNSFKSIMKHKTSSNWRDSWKLALISMTGEING